MLEVEIRNNFAKNVKDLRVSRKLNQIQLGEKLAYSSKAVSKWENGDVMPDIVTLKMIADFFEVGVDDLISDKNVVRKSHKKFNHLLITIVSSCLPFFIAAITCLVLSLLQIDKAWMSFIAAVAVSGIVLVTFSSIWYHRLEVMLSTILIIIGVAVMVLFFVLPYWWIILTASLILILLTIIFFSIRFSSKK